MIWPYLDTVSCLNLRLFTISVKSKVHFQCHSKIPWLEADSSMTWFPFCFLSRCVRIFFLTQILVTAPSKKILRKLLKNFCQFDKRMLFSRFLKSNRNIFGNTSKGNCFFIFLIMFPRHVHMSWEFKEHWNFLHFKAYFHLLN